MQNGINSASWDITFFCSREMVARIAGRVAASSERKALTPILSREERERGISRIAETRPKY
jgi:hypothetical protein